MTSSKEDTKGANDENAMPQKFLILFIVGFFIILVGIIILMVTTILYGEDSANFGALIFIGPLPIVVGAGPEATWMFLFAIILAVLSIVTFLIMRRRVVKKKARLF
jgi:uncharacterized membrane protein